MSPADRGVRERRLWAPRGHWGTHRPRARCGCAHPSGSPAHCRRSALPVGCRGLVPASPSAAAQSATGKGEEAGRHVRQGSSGSPTRGQTRNHLRVEPRWRQVRWGHSFDFDHQLPVGGEDRGRLIEAARRRACSGGAVRSVCVRATVPRARGEAGTHSRVGAGTDTFRMERRQRSRPEGGAVAGGIPAAATTTESGASTHRPLYPATRPWNAQGTKPDAEASSAGSANTPGISGSARARRRMVAICRISVHDTNPQPSLKARARVSPQPWSFHHRRRHRDARHHRDSILSDHVIDLHQLLRRQRHCGLGLREGETHPGAQLALAHGIVGWVPRYVPAPQLLHREWGKSGSTLREEQHFSSGPLSESVGSRQPRRAWAPSCCTCARTFA